MISYYGMRECYLNVFTNPPKRIHELFPKLTFVGHENPIEVQDTTICGTSYDESMNRYDQELELELSKEAPKLQTPESSTQNPSPSQKKPRPNLNKPKSSRRNSPNQTMSPSLSENIISPV
ncbi:hypothetical protein WR25_26234 [Diploscapter pachys]|uniref:Uncharacterized protein n=1 Tax=Diploscapter pachys TaxID=2018661 RepID=A0A2A2JSM7_9BILA|nr:hypothetical protein WR25_26234 [Diploscapter pachys]